MTNYDKILRLCFPLVSIFDKDCVHMSFHGNQIEDKVAILLLKTFH